MLVCGLRVCWGRFSALEVMYGGVGLIYARKRTQQKGAKMAIFGPKKTHFLNFDRNPVIFDFRPD